VELGLQEQQQLIIWSLLVVVDQVSVAVAVVELEVIELLVMAQVLYKDQRKN
jgi:hypothetical protein